MTIIAKGSVFTGSFSSEGNVRIDGTIRGDVTTTDSLEVGKTGLVVGSTINAKTVVVHGRVEGHLIAPQHITLGGKATLVGDLKTGSLIIEEGAVFHGTASMMDSDHVKNVEIKQTEVVSK
ncbi:MAG: polymer-forming cytoskeletal protein [Gemmatimonadota bacterium]|nr:polymer-forming cytoskeletal protein [Gemmatimonadota bacterium]